MSHLPFYRLILSRYFIVRQNRKCDMTFVQLINSRATFFPIRAALYSVQLCHENAVNTDWPILVYVTNLQCATWHVSLAILSCDKIAGVTLIL